MTSTTGHNNSVNVGPGATSSDKGRPKQGRITCAAFTLLELILVMLIICTILAIASPSLRGFFASRESKDAAEQVVALTKLAHSLAVTEGRPYRLNLDINEGQYWLTVQDGGVYRNLGTEQGRIFSLPRDALMATQGLPTVQGASYIEFDPTGRCQAGRIQIVDRRGDTITILCPTPTEHYFIANGEVEYNEWNT